MHTTGRFLHRARTAATIAVVGLVLVACGGGDDDAAAGAGTQEEAVDETAGDEAPSEDDAPSEQTSDPTDGSAPVTTAETDLGTILVTADGATLYGFTNDEQGVASACTGDCLAAWPPLLVEGGSVPAGLDASVFDVIARDDGTVQLTAGGWPLYTYAADQAAGDTNGQAVGDVWWVVTPSGELVMDAG